MTHEFVIQASADPQTLPRLIEELARHWITPKALEATRSGDALTVRLVATDITCDQARIIGNNLGRNVLVLDVAVHRTD